MAVDAGKLNLFHPQQLMPNREFVNVGFENAQMGSAAVLPFAAVGTVFPLHPSLVQAADSGLTYNLQRVSNKRPAEPFNQIAGDDVLTAIQQCQLEIDDIISHHTKKMKMEFEERQKQQGRILVAAMGEMAMWKLREKDDHIQRMAKINFALQEKVKSLYIENQLWRNLAQSNEATANSLRSNLEQVLAHMDYGAGDMTVEEDAGSCCGGGYEEQEVGTAVPEPELTAGRICRNCRERESTVLLLPCRHLCLCSICGSTMPRNCPVCNSTMNATVHVNMS